MRIGVSFGDRILNIYILVAGSAHIHIPVHIPVHILVHIPVRVDFISHSIILKRHGQS